MGPKGVIIRTLEALLGSVVVAMGSGVGGACCGCSAATISGAMFLFAVVLSELLQPEALQKMTKAAQLISEMDSLFIVKIEVTKIMKD
jgi:hypothetical protein